MNHRQWLEWANGEFWTRAGNLGDLSRQLWAYLGVCPPYMVDRVKAAIAETYTRMNEGD
jgi:hypothetical protein